MMEIKKTLTAKIYQIKVRDIISAFFNNRCHVDVTVLCLIIQFDQVRLESRSHIAMQSIGWAPTGSGGFWRVIIQHASSLLYVETCHPCYCQPFIVGQSVIVLLWIVVILLMIIMIFVIVIIMYAFFSCSTLSFIYITLLLCAVSMICYCFACESSFWAAMNNNNHNNHDSAYGAIVMTQVTARVHPVHLMNVDWALGGRQSSDQGSRLGLWVCRKLAATIHICPWCDSNLDPLTPVRCTRPLRPECTDITC